MKFRKMIRVCNLSVLPRRKSLKLIFLIFLLLKIHLFIKWFSTSNYDTTDSFDNHLQTQNVCPHDASMLIANQSKLSNTDQKVAFKTTGAKECNMWKAVSSKGYRSLITSFCRWRLGNQLSSFATGYALWRRFGVQNVIVGDQFDSLRDIFYIPVPKKNVISNWPYYVWNERCYEKNTFFKEQIEWTRLQIGFNARININNVTVCDSEVLPYANGKYLHLLGYVNRVKLFLPWLQELKEYILRFKTFYIHSAQEKLQKINCYGNKVTIVSIHVRLTDYRENLLHGIPEAADENYFSRAMEYYIKKYQNVCFFAVSDDIIKAKKLLQSQTNEKYKVSFPGDGEATKPGNDLAMLSLADHSILSYGTFGIWGALLRKKDGEVVLPKLKNESFSADIIKREWQIQALKENAYMDSYGYEIPNSWIKL